MTNVVPGWTEARSRNVESRLNEWFDTTCFTQPPAFTSGDEARVDPILRAQGINNLDFALFKTTNFGPGERLGLQFRTEFFNLFKTPQFGPPGTAVGTAQFGIVSSQVNNPRLIQFALKFLFYEKPAARKKASLWLPLQPVPYCQLRLLALTQSSNLLILAWCEPSQ